MHNLTGAQAGESPSLSLCVKWFPLFLAVHLVSLTGCNLRGTMFHREVMNSMKSPSAASTSMRLMLASWGHTSLDVKAPKIPESAGEQHTCSDEMRDNCWRHGRTSAIATSCRSNVDSADGWLRSKKLLRKPPNLALPTCPEMDSRSRALHVIESKSKPSIGGEVLHKVELDN